MSRPRKNLINHEVGQLLVIEFVDVKHGHARWKCRCICGNYVIVRGSSIRSGNTQSCGCWRQKTAQQNGKLTKQHGLSGGPNKKAASTYISWKCMWQRCTNPKHCRYNDYGGRGIKVCKRWKKFENFLEDMHTRPHGKTLDRIEVEGDYCPTNCRWATAKEQANNKRQKCVT